MSESFTKAVVEQKSLTSEAGCLSATGGGHAVAIAAVFAAPFAVALAAGAAGAAGAKGTISSFGTAGAAGATGAAGGAATGGTGAAPMTGMMRKASLRT